MEMLREEFTVEPKLYDDQVVGIEYQIVWQDDNESEREVILGRFSQEEYATNAFTKYIDRLSKNNNLNLYPDSTYEQTKIVVEFKDSSKSGNLFVRSKEVVKERFNFRAAERIFNPNGYNNQRNNIRR